SKDYWEIYLVMRELVVIATCVLFFLCGAWWFLPMNIITLGSVSSSGWLTAHAEYAKATLLNDIGIIILVALAALTYKRHFFLPLFLVVAITIWAYLIYLDITVPFFGM
ncbi:MAG: hypothetical protein M3328_14565, partial [Chloroflexota bacterium]|nr:hypothetical protein [Chloroflexota bacterium]